MLALKREGYRKGDFDMKEVAAMMAYPGLWRMAAKQWRYAIGEFHRSLNTSAFMRELQRLVPEVTESDVVPDGSGVRAQALRRDGLLVDDFEFAQAENILHLWNVPSPAATASLPVGRMIAEMVAKALT